MINSNFEAEVLVHGSPVKEYFHEGRFYIEGRPNTEYSLRLKNNSGRRVLAVPTVDGLSVMNGKPGNFKSSGYILDSYSSTIIDGWRTSDKEVRRFYFTDPSKSYAQKTGKGGNHGVIGIAFFYESDASASEKVLNEFNRIAKEIKDDFDRMSPWKPWRQNIWPRDDFYYWDQPNINMCSSGSQTTNVLTPATTTNNVASKYNSSLDSNSVGRDLGTGFGDLKHSSVIEVEFQRARDIPDAIVEVFYSSKKSLEEAGVKFESPLYTSPSSFPGESKYCQEPK